jgi:hypothetical protein
MTAKAESNEETVFFLDLLGFRSMTEGDGRSAVQALTTVAELYTPGSKLGEVGGWSHRYALSDSVFLTHPSPAPAVGWAAETARMILTASAGVELALVRGGMAHGAVQHLHGVFGQSGQPANLLGAAVSRAVELEAKTPEKGPRIFVEESLAKVVSTSHPVVGAWLLDPTAVSGVWEVLWPLPESPGNLGDDAWRTLEWLTKISLALFEKRGGHARYGGHYRGFVRLVARSLLRIAEWTGSPAVPQRERVADLLPRRRLVEVLGRTSGIPELDALFLLDAADRLRLLSKEPHAT